MGAQRIHYRPARDNLPGPGHRDAAVSSGTGDDWRVGTGHRRHAGRRTDIPEPMAARLKADWNGAYRGGELGKVALLLAA